MLGMGGMEKNVINLILRLDPAYFEHVICVVRSLGSMVDLVVGRARVICLDRTQTGRSFLGRALAKLIEEVRPDIVHSRNWGTIETILAGTWTGNCALVHSEHGLDAAQAHSEPLRRRALRRLAFQLADRVCCVSFALRDHHARSTGFPPGRIEVIHNGVDTGRYRPIAEARSRMREQLGIKGTEFCIGAIGRLEPVKDLFTLLRAARGLPADRSPWRIVIAGDGSESEALRDFVNNSAELRDRTRFLGEVKDVPNLLNAFDVYVLPSLYEGISNSLLEAMATGLPVVASAVGGNHEVVEDGESGLLVPAGDSQALADRLMALQQPSESRVRLSHKAMERVRAQFSLESMVNGYDGLYRGLT
jgi:sugar transferase (PEP-CTERM/EpsH1 system associated)